MLHLFEHARPGDDRPRRAIELARAWARGEIKTTQARTAAFANAAAREASGAAKQAALAAAQAMAVSHVPAHELGAAAPEGEQEQAGRLKCRWQRAQLPGEIRELVLDDQRLHSEVCWSVFDC